MLHGDWYSRLLLDAGKIDLYLIVIFFNLELQFFYFDSVISFIVFSSGIFFWCGKSRSRVSLYLRSAVISSNHFCSRHLLLYCETLFLCSFNSVLVISVLFLETVKKRQRLQYLRCFFYQKFANTVNLRVNSISFIFYYVYYVADAVSTVAFLYVFVFLHVSYYFAEYINKFQ